MGPSRTRAGAAPSGLFSALLFCATFAGCQHYCLVVQSNPGGAINTNTSCPATTTTANVTLSIGSSLASDSAASEATAPIRAPHIFVTLRGIDALPASIPGDDAPAWQPLAPQLAERPVQVDFNERVGDSCSPDLTGTATFPAGVYSQLRLRFMPNPAPSDSAALPLDASVCGANLLNCLISPEAAALPLAFDDPASIVIPSDRIAGGFLRILPDTSVHLAITLDLRSSLALPAANSLRFIPAFSVSAQTSCSR